VAFEQPVFVVVGGELADAGAELLERVEAFDPQHLPQPLDRVLLKDPRLFGELYGSATETRFARDVPDLRVGR